MTKSDTAKAIVTWVAVIGLFLLTLWSLWLNRSATAAVAGALMIAIGLSKHLPIIESFEVFTLKAKFARQVTEADKLIADIRALAEVSSRLMYYQIGKGDRMASMSWDMKRDQLSDVDGLLLSLKVPADTVATLKTPFLHTVSLDLFRVLEHTAAHRLQQHWRAANAAIVEYQKRGAIPAGDPEYSRLLAERGKWELPFRTTQDIMDDGRLDDMSAITERLLAETPLSPDEFEKLEVVRAEVVRFDQACKREGTITPEAQAYLERYQSTDARAEELFAAQG